MSSHAAQMFLHLALKGAGKAKGESQAEGHEDDIEVLAWRWGASARIAVGATEQTARRSYRELSITKAFDSASTALLTAVKKNDQVSLARLTMRKAGGEPLAYFTMELTGARVSTLEYSADDTGKVCEVLTLSFAEVKIEYHPQQGEGALGPAHVFDDVV